jgi:precorrin-4 methylase
MSDAELGRIGTLMPRGLKGAHREDDRTVIAAVVSSLRIGAQSPDCPTNIMCQATVYQQRLIRGLPSVSRSTVEADVDASGETLVRVCDADKHNRLHQ